MPDATLGEGLEDEVHVGHTAMVAQAAAPRIRCQVNPTAPLPIRSAASRPRAGMTWL
jgi:hypothetical protein